MAGTTITAVSLICSANPMATPDATSQAQCRRSIHWEPSQADTSAVPMVGTSTITEVLSTNTPGEAKRKHAPANVAHVPERCLVRNKGERGSLFFGGF
jgi:hypothetical protein